MLTISSRTPIIPTTLINTELPEKEITPSEESAVYEYWFREANQPLGDIANTWKCLKHENNFNEFVTLLTRFSEPKLAKKISAADVVKLIQSVIKLPLIRELVFKAVKEAEPVWDTFTKIKGYDPVWDKFTKIKDYVKFGEHCKFWYTEAGKSAPAFPEKWESLKDNEKFTGFTALLNRLRNSQSDLPIKAAEVVEVIESVIRSPSIRTPILKESYDANSDCRDRPFSIFLRIQGFALFEKLEREGATPQKLFALAIRIAKQDLIDGAVFKVLENQKKNEENNDDPLPYEKEALEYQMAICDALGKELNLPFYAQPSYMNHCINRKTMKKPTKEDLQIVKNYVNEIVEKPDLLVEKLISHPVWKNYLSEQYKDNILIIDSKFKSLSSQLEVNHTSKSISDKEYTTELFQIDHDYKQALNTLLKSKTRQLYEDSRWCTLL